MGHYIWQNKDWPNFTWASDQLIEGLGSVRKAQGKLIAQAGFMGLESEAEFLIEEALMTSAIEGESLNADSVRSSVAHRLGLPTAGLPPQQRHIEGLIEMLLDATRMYDKPFNSKRMFGWHAALFPTGYSGLHKINTAKWRSGNTPMQVVSGPIGKEKVHFEAPPAKLVSKEMKTFFNWWSKPPDKLDGLLRAGIAHLWFVTVHPFDDGNGRIARAITDMALAQDEDTGQRFYSLSGQIVKERTDYYDILEQVQKQNCDITQWLEWFLGLFARAISNSGTVIDKVLLVSNFWQQHSQLELNERQLKVIKKLIEAEPEGFVGGINNRKYVSLTKVSRETAKRDLADLEKKNIIKRNAGKGRSVSYSLIIK